MAKENKKIIEKPWAVYGWKSGSYGIGKVVQDFNNALWIKDFDEDDLTCWEPKWVKTFKTSGEAARYFFENQVPCEVQFSKSDITKCLFANFPKALKQEAVQSLHDALFVYQNKLSSQSSPKCTKLSKTEKINYTLEQSNIC